MTTTFITLDVWQPSNIRVKVNQGEVNSRFLQVKILDKKKTFRACSHKICANKLD